MTVSTSTLAWRLCQAPGAGLPYQFVDGQRMLTVPEMDALIGALKKVMLSTRMVCGADKPILVLKVTNPAGEKQYLDDFYSCTKQGVYVAGLDGVFQVLRPLAK
jgi:hypothetical protein